jgi:REP element-mobilizing transposase RayT
MLQHISFRVRDGISLEAELGGYLQEAFLHFDGSRYDLQAWCIMPDHCHIVAVFDSEVLMHSVVWSWKRWAAGRWNHNLGRSGPVFDRDYFDRYARNFAQAERMIHYVEYNPVADGLVVDPTDWPLSLAAYRKTGWQPSKGHHFAFIDKQPKERSCLSCRAARIAALQVVALQNALTHPRHQQSRD